MGRQIRELVNDMHNPGMNKIQWNTKNYKGQQVSAGIYLYSIEAGNFRQTRKMILLK